MRTDTESPGDASDREIVVSRIVDASQDLVWKAVTSPEHVVHWWGPRGFTMTIEKMEVRPGGTWKHVLHGPDGTDYPNLSTYIEVSPPERLVLRQTGGRKGSTPVDFRSTWTFLPAGAGRTEVKIRMVFATPALRDQIAKEYGAVKGGEQTLERLAERLPSMDPGKVR